MSLEWNNTSKVIMMFNEDIHLERNNPQKKTNNRGRVYETDRVQKTMFDIFSLVSNFAYGGDYHV